MKYLNFLKILLILSVFAFFTACSDDDGDDNPTDPGNGDGSTPDLQVKQITPPQKMQDAANNGNPGAAQAVAYISLANSLPTYADLLEPPEGSGKVSATNAPAEEWTWTEGGASMTLTLNETETTYSWTLTIDGTYSGETYSNQVVMEANGSKNGSNGQLYFYSPDAASPVLSFDWETLADGTYHLVIESAQGSASTTSELYAYSDDSGSLDINMSGGGSWDIDWASDGSGTWAQYDEQGGLVDQGTWG